MKNVIDFMRHNTRVLSLLSAVLFFLFPQLGFGASSAFTVPSTDLSVVLLGKIFGTVGGGLETGGSSILGKMFYVFNSGILVIIGMILIYIVGRSIFEISHGDTSQMGRKFSGWQVLRVVLGTGSVVPQATGYSAINVMIMWVVIQGVGMANAVWKQAVTYIAEGNSFYVMDKANNTTGPSSLIDVNFIKSDAASPAQAGSCEKSGVGCVTAQELMKAQICMNSLYRAAEDSRIKKLKDINNLTAEEQKKYTDYTRVLQQSIPRFREAYHGKVVGGTSYIVEFPGNASAVPFVSENSLTKTINNTPKDYNGVCGKYSWGNVPSVTGKTTDMENYRSVKETALRSLILSLSSASFASIETYKPFDPASSLTINCPNDAKSNKTGFYPCTYLFPDYFQQNTYTSVVYAVANYQSTIFPMRSYAGKGYNLNQTKAKVGSKEITTNMVDNLTKNGWIGAGSFYLNLTSVQNSAGYESAKDTNYYPNIISSMSQDLESKFQNYGEIGKKYYSYMQNRHRWLISKNDVNDTIFNKASTLAETMNVASRNASGELNLPTVLDDFVRGEKGKTIDIKAPWGAKSAAFIVLSPLNEELVKVLQQWKTVFDPLSTDQNGKNKLPLLRLHELGKTMIQSFFDYWDSVFSRLNALMYVYFGVSTVFTGISAGLAAFSTLGVGVGAQLALQQAQSLLGITSKMFLEIPLMILLPMITPITLILLLNGVLLAYYIPLLPFMLFLFGTVTWFSFVIEGMVAGPLIALGVTHPEGHDLMGKAEQTLMLLVSLFIRPTVMIFGLIAGLLLSYVGLEVLNATFGALLNGALSSSGSKQDTYYALFSSGLFSISNTGLTATAQVQNVAFILMYTFIIMSLMQQCFSLIYSLPSMVMMWIGGPHKEGQEAQLVGEVKGNMSQTADRASSGVGSSASASSAFGSVVNSFKMNDDKNKDSGKSDIQQNNPAPPNGGRGGGNP